MTDPTALAAAIQRSGKHDAVIGVDGWLGAGKTFLAEVLAKATEGRTFDLDSALDKGRNCYVDALRKEEISRNISGGGLLFVSGVCLREVLASVNIRADIHIYVKRMAAWGWADEDDVLTGIPEIAPANGETLRMELRDYHRKWRPHLYATYEFHWLG